MISSRGRGYSRRTAAVYLSAVKRLLEWLDARGQLPQAFSLTQAEHRLTVHRGRRGRPGYRRRPVDDRVPQIVTYYDDLPLPLPDSPRECEQRLIILRNRALVHVLYATAARVSEMISLTRQQVRDGNADEVQIVGKGNKQRVLFLGSDAKAAIQAYLEERTDRNPWLFIPHNGRRPGHVGRTTVWYVVKEAALALGLDRATSPHTFRHYRATQLLNNGMPLESIQALLGHASITTTRTVYADTFTATLREQIEQCSIPARQAVQLAGA
jgi:site-specific recombinase XerD